MRKLLFTAVLTYLVCNSLAGHLVVPFSTVFAQTTTITNTTTSATANNRNSSATTSAQIATEQFPTQATVEKQTKDAEVIVEAHWLKSYPIVTKDSLRYAVCEIKVFKLFKGKITTDTLSVVSYCHRAENTAERCAAGLWPYSIGVFFIRSTNKFDDYIDSKYPQYQFISPFNSFIEEFDEIRPENLSIPPIRKANIKEFRKNKSQLSLEYLVPLRQNMLTLHKNIEKAVGKKAKVYYDIFSGKWRRNMSKTNKHSSSQRSASQAPIITSFSPTSLPGGYLDDNTSLLTIQGSGFGTVTDRVYFTNANSGGIANDNPDYVKAHPDVHIVSWTDTEIKVKVPSRGYRTSTENELYKTAGTGKIKIRNKQTGGLTESNEILTIPHSITNVVDGDMDFPQNYEFFEYHLRDLAPTNTDADFIFVYDTTFFNNTLALAAFRRALETWRCATGIRFKEECASDSLCSDTNTGTKIKISFAKDCFPLPTTDTKATTQLFNTTDATPPNPNALFCNTSGRFYLPRAEIIFNPTPPCATTGTCSWSFTTTSPNDNVYNFEATALHELGHLLMLQHVIDPGNVMHFTRGHTVQPNDNVTIIDNNTLAGANYVLTRDSQIIPQNCDVPPLQILPANDRCGTLNPCTSLCPTPTLNTPIDFTATNNCTTFSPYTADLFGIATEQQVTLSLTTSLPIGYTLTWSIDGATILSGTTTSSTLTVKWTNPGEKLISLNISNGNSCTTRQKVIGVHQIGNCQISGEAVESFIPPSNCVEDNGSLTLAIPYNGSFCYHYLVSRNNQIIYNQAITDSSVIYNQIINGSSDIYTLDSLTAGNYTVTLNDLATGCYIEQHFALPPANPLSVDVTEVAANYSANGSCNGAISIAALGGTAPYTYQWSNNSTTTVPHITGLCGNALGGTATYTVTVTDSGGCTATTTANVNGSWVISIHEALCNCDLLIAGNPVTDQVIATARLSTSSNTPPNSNAQVLLELYNSMGIKVATLYNGTLPVPSNEAQTYSVANLPNGLYYLRLRTCGNSKTKAIVIM